MDPRPTPFDLVLARFAQERFPPLRAALEASGRNPADRDAFLMERLAVEAVRELRPGDGLGEGIGGLVALLHHAYLFWAAGRPVSSLDRTGVEAALAAPGARAPGAPRYLQLPPRLVWAEAVPGSPAEPLDGIFVHPTPGGLRALGVFGLHPGRDGFTVVEVEGPRPAELVRPDGSGLFTPILPGGEAAGIHSLTGGEELLDLAWRLGGLP